MAFNHTVPAEVDLEGRAKLMLVITERDIVFNCPSCHGELVVDRDGAGLEVSCSHCNQTLTVPPHQPRAVAESPSTLSMVQSVDNVTEAPARSFGFDAFSPEQLQRRLDELKHQLKENRSQDTEMRGHVNRATMELHRLQLRLKKLQERHGDIEAELTAIHAHIAPAVS